MSYRMGSGKTRRSWRIVEWMRDRGLSNDQIALDLDVDPSLVSHTIHGRRNSRIVLAKLRDLGCPTNILSLPEDMMRAA